jgi:hypothetical protein
MRRWPGPCERVPGWSSALYCSFNSSPAPTSPACCWRAAPSARPSSACVPPSGPPVATSSGWSSRRVSCSQRAPRCSPSSLRTSRSDWGRHRARLGRTQSRDRDRLRRVPFHRRAVAAHHLIAGIPAALASTRTNVADLIRSGTRTATGSHARHRSLRALVVAQIVIAFLLVNVAVLLSTSYRNMGEVNKALSSEFVLSASLSLQGDRYDGRLKARARFCDHSSKPHASLPGVVAAGTTSKLPLEGGSNTTIPRQTTRSPTRLQKRPLIEISSITPEYFYSPPPASNSCVAGRSNRAIPAGSTSASSSTAPSPRNTAGQRSPRAAHPPELGNARMDGHCVGSSRMCANGVPRAIRNPRSTGSPNVPGTRKSFLIVRSQQPADQLSESLSRKR